MLDKECRSVFDFIDKRKDGKISYVDYVKNFESKDMNRKDLEDAELKFLQNPIEETGKLNYLKETKLAMKTGRRPHKPLFGIANSGQGSYAQILSGKRRGSSRGSSHIMDDIISQGQMSYTSLPKNVNPNAFTNEINVQRDRRQKKMYSKRKYALPTDRNMTHTFGKAGPDIPDGSGQNF